MIQSIAKAVEGPNTRHFEHCDVSVVNPTLRNKRRNNTVVGVCQRPKLIFSRFLLQSYIAFVILDSITQSKFCASAFRIQIRDAPVCGDGMLPRNERFYTAVQNCVRCSHEKTEHRAFCLLFSFVESKLKGRYFYAKKEIGRASCRERV
jgi:hypothetical protein